MKSNVVGVKWQDTKIILTIEGSKEEYYLKNSKMPNDKVKLQYYSQNKYAVNVINIGDKRPLAEGIWYLVNEQEELIKANRDINEEKSFKYKEISKIKIYHDAQYNFNAKNDAEKFIISVNIILGKGVYSFSHLAKMIFFKGISSILNKKINNKEIIFLTSKPYIEDGNGKVLSDYIKKDIRLQEYNITQINHDTFFIKGNLKVKLKILYQLLRAKFIFVEDHYKIIENLDFNKTTEIIQLWHAAGAYKKVGYSRFGALNGPSLYKNAHRKYTKAIVSSKRLIPYYAEAYGIDEKDILATGLPRIDKFLEVCNQQSIVQEIYLKYPLFKMKKIILYAPTFREKLEQGKYHYYYDYSKIDFKALYDFCKDDYICLFKFHPFVEENMEIPRKYQDKLMNISDYQYSINNLLYITDILITDYSSVIFEFSLLQRPILIFAYDIEEYEANRGMYESLNTFAKDSVCEKFEDVIKRLQSMQFESTYETIFKSAFDSADSYACERIVKEIFKGEIR